MAPKLYMVPPSPPVRAVLMTAKALNLNLEVVKVDLKNGEHLKPEFLKLNPQHTVPVLVEEDGFTLWDSHAIMAYLVSKYGKDDSLYPKDLRKRAVIDQRLHFESGVAFARLVQIIRPILTQTKRTLEQADRDVFEEVYGFMEAFLQDKQWIAGDSVTIADYSLIASATSSNIVHPIDAKKYPKATAWLKKTQALPAYEANKEGIEMFKGMIQASLG